MKVDLHIHTSYSYDSLTPPGTVLRKAREAGLDAIAITDHNVIDGAFQAAEQNEIQVIIGEEVWSGEGDIIGLFLKKRIPPRLGAQRTVECIKEQDGIVYIPHPLCRLVPSRVKLRTLERILPYVDVLEGINARARFPRDSIVARQFAGKCNLSVGAGSDAHFAFEVGRAGVEIPEFTTPQEFKDSIRSAQLFGQSTSMYQSFRTLVLMCVRRPIMRWVGPGPYEPRNNEEIEASQIAAASTLERNHLRSYEVDPLEEV